MFSREVSISIFRTLIADFPFDVLSHFVLSTYLVNNANLGIGLDILPSLFMCSHP